MVFYNAVSFQKDTKKSVTDFSYGHCKVTSSLKAVVKAWIQRTVWEAEEAQEIWLAGRQTEILEHRKQTSLNSGTMKTTHKVSTARGLSVALWLKQQPGDEWEERRG